MRSVIQSGFSRLNRTGREPAVEQHVDDRDHVKREEGAREHASDHRDSHGATAFCTRTKTNGDRHDARHRGKGRHENGPEPNLAGFHHGRHRVDALLSPLVGVFHQQDGILGHQPDEEHRPIWLNKLMFMDGITGMTPT